MAATVGMSEPTTGTPAASDSITENGWPSTKVGNTNTSACDNWRYTSSRGTLPSSAAPRPRRSTSARTRSFSGSLPGVVSPSTLSS